MTKVMEDYYTPDKWIMVYSAQRTPRYRLSAGMYVVPKGGIKPMSLSLSYFKMDECHCHFLPLLHFALFHKIGCKFKTSKRS